MSEKYEIPKYKQKGFTCPNCGHFSSQKWKRLFCYTNDTISNLPNYTPTINLDTSSGVVGASSGYSVPTKAYIENLKNTELSLSRCDLCEDFCIWSKDIMVYPASFSAPVPNPDIPDDVKEDFLEAGKVVGLSPRSASALLRLALEKLLRHLDCNGNDINDNIRILVEKGLPKEIQESLDLVRVIGNEAVHLRNRACEFPE